MLKFQQVMPSEPKSFFKSFHCSYQMEILEFVHIHGQRQHLRPKISYDTLLCLFYGAFLRAMLLMDINGHVMVL